MLPFIFKKPPLTPMCFCLVWLQKLQEQAERAELLKGRLRWEQQELRVRLEQLQAGGPPAMERTRNDSLGSAVSSERSDSDRGELRTGHFALSDKHKCLSGFLFPQLHTPYFWCNRNSEPIKRQTKKLSGKWQRILGAYKELPGAPTKLPGRESITSQKSDYEM